MYYMEKEIKKQKASIEEKEKKINLIIIIIIIAIIMLDQILKLIILKFGEIQIINGILKLNLYQNNINGETNSKIMNIFSHIVILGIIFKFMRTQNEFIDTKLKVILSFIFAGGCSNLIDRIFRGSVMEFIDFTSIVNIPIFNIADIFVLIGWIGMAAIFSVFTVEEWRKNKSKKESRN